MKYPILLITLSTLPTVPTLSAMADIHKCINSNEEITYQDMPCSELETNAEISQGYLNELPVAPPLEEQEAMDNLRKARKARRAAHVHRRNEAIKEHTRRYEERAAECEQLREDHHALVIYKRRNGRSGNNYENNLIKKMRVACSGWHGG